MVDIEFCETFYQDKARYMRIGLFGGSFDPVHWGHLLLAESCREHCHIDQIWFIPNSVSPYKTHQGPSESRHRIEMLKLATGGHPGFLVCEIETARGGVSFTVDTIRTIHDKHPKDELFFLMGADSLVDFPSWKQPDDICKLASIVTVGRPNAKKPDFHALQVFLNDEEFSKLEKHYVEMPQVEISSSEIRKRVAAHQSIRYRVPRAVEKYIESHRLYSQ